MLKVGLTCVFLYLMVRANVYQEYLDEPGSFNVTNVNLLKPATPEGYNVNATVAFRNPSPFIVELVRPNPNLLSQENTNTNPPGLCELQPLHKRHINGLRQYPKPLPTRRHH